jgi:hypothetical protein
MKTKVAQFVTPQKLTLWICQQKAAMFCIYTLFVCTAVKIGLSQGSLAEPVC